MESNKPTPQRLEIRGSLIARNTLLNLLGQGLPLVVAVVTMPFIIRGLGTERFGVLALAWAVLGYFSIFDLGLGRAATKFVAEALGKGEQEKVPAITWTAVSVQAVFSILGGFILAGITPLLVKDILNIPQELIGEALSSFYILAISIPIVLVSGSFRGVLEAAQRFDLVNAVKIPFSAANFLLPLVGVLLGWGLPGIIVLLVASRSLALIIQYLLCTRVFRSLKGLPRFSWAELNALFSFGTWVTVSNVVGPILRYLDRFIIGTLLTVTAVTYYTVPFEVVTRFYIIPSSLVMALFPAFSTLGIRRRKDLQQLYIRAIKHLLLVTGPIVLPLTIFAGDVIQIWLGPDFVEKSKLTFQILLFGTLIDLPAIVSGALIEGLGYPKILSKLNLLYLPLHIGLTWFLVQAMGISGAALSFALRTSIYTVVLSIVSCRLIDLRFHTIKNSLLRSVGILTTFVVLLLGVSFINSPLYIKLTFLAITIVSFGITTWYYILDAQDKRLLLSLNSWLWIIAKISHDRGKGIPR